MNNESNNQNNGQNVVTIPVVPQQPVQPVPVVPQQPVQPAPVVPQQPVQPVPVVDQQIPTTVVEPTSVAGNGTFATPQQPVDNGAMVNENLQKVEIKNYTPPSKFKVFILLVFFALLIAFIIFLPDISSMIRNYRNGETYQKEEIITTGKLICTLNTNTTDLDKEYEFDFSFTDSKLKKTKYIVNTRGDVTTESTLDVLAENCKNLKNETSELEGISIRCEYTENRLIETQVFDLETVDVEKLTTAYTEAGGILPSYKLDQDIDGIEKNMKASNYTCERTN